MASSTSNNSSTKGRTLIFYTGAYPCAVNTAPFVEREMETLMATFDRVIVVPIATKVEDNVVCPHGAEVLSAPARLYASPAGKCFLFTIGLFYLPFLIPDIQRAKVLGQKVRVPDSPRGTLRSIITIGFDLMVAKHLKKMVPAGSKALVYHFWLFAIGYVADRNLRKSGRIGSIVARAHGHDLFSEERGNQLALMRYPYINMLDEIWTVCDAGTDFLIDDVKVPATKVKTLLLGGPDYGALESRPESDDELSIVSCSYVSDYKRVTLVGQVCKMLSEHPEIKSVKWTHIGDGPELPKLKEQFAQANPKLKVTFTGWVAASEVRGEIAKTRPHLFLHLAKWEGLPIAVLEALSMGLPCVAAGASGTADVVDSSVGCLLSTDDPAEKAVDAVINVFKRVTSDSGEALRMAARKRFLDHFSLSATLPMLVEELNEAWDFGQTRTHN